MWLGVVLVDTIREGYNDVCFDRGVGLELLLGVWEIQRRFVGQVEQASKIHCQ